MASPANEAAAIRAQPAARRIVRSFGYAFHGIAAMLRSTPNSWVHLGLGAVALACALALGLGPTDVALIVLCIGLVLVVESVNTALESLCDLVSPDYHPLVERAKDIGAAAVLLAAATAVVVGLLLFVPHLAAILPR